MGNKTFKTIDEQIQILRDKNLIINDEVKAKEILFRENYFFISGYRHFFMNGPKSLSFIKGTTFNELYAVFSFDRYIRNIMFKNILIIENNVKSIISYQLSKNYGYREEEYLNSKNYNQDPTKTKQVNDILNKMKRQMRSNVKEHSATYHYISTYGYIPMWILVKVLSFGIIAEVYTILKYDDQEKIAEYYGIDVDTLITYLTMLSNFRNICAHEEILYDYRPQRKIPDRLYHRQMNISKNEEGEYIFGKNDLFALIIILKDLLTKDDFRNMLNEVGYEVDILDGKVSTVSLESIINKIGFPPNWREISEI